MNRWLIAASVMLLTVTGAWATDWPSPSTTIDFSEFPSGVSSAFEPGYYRDRGVVFEVSAGHSLTVGPNYDSATFGNSLTATPGGTDPIVITCWFVAPGTDIPGKAMTVYFDVLDAPDSYSLIQATWYTSARTPAYYIGDFSKPGNHLFHSVLGRPSSDYCFGGISITTAADHPVALDNIAFNDILSDVPEPSSILALLTGLAGIGGMAVRRRK